MTKKLQTLNKLARENDRLKNELAVQAALEKVRSVAMGMKKPEDMLGICKMISKQLGALGIKEIRNIQTGIFYPEKGSYMNYQYYTRHDKTFITDTVYTDHKVAKRFVTKMLKGKGQLSVTHIKGRQKLKEWIAYQKGTNVFLDKYLYTASSLHYYWYSLGPVALGISTYQQLTKEEWALFQRFLNVFELAYRRYLDIEKAEAQAREAKIEMALERVRARSLAMHSSNELAEVVGLLYKQFGELDFGLYQVLVSILDKKNDTVEWWSRGFDETELPKKYLIPLIDHPFPNMQKKQWNSGVDFYAHVLRGEVKKSWEEYLFTKTELKNFPKKIKDQMRSLETVYLSDAFMKFGCLQAAGPTPLPDEKVGILKRFAKVLDQAYTRMTDLQKAEAQAREAQIEAALERVRSATMAMHTSDELTNVIKVLTDQLTVLGFDFHTANFITNASMPDWDLWISSPGSNIPPKLFVPYFDHRLFNERNGAVSSGKEMLTVTLTPKEKRKFLEYFFEHSSAKDTDQERKKWVLAQKGMALTTVVTKSFSLSVVNYYGTLFSDDENDVIKRLAYVFEQSYTRFLDLQKAEAQAREARIEVALERVRSKAMAMHKSEDLNDAVAVAFEELDKLDLGVLRIGISVLNKEKRCGNVWLTSVDKGKAVQVTGDESFDIHPLLQGAFEAWLRQEDFYYVLEGDDLIHYYQAVEAAKFRLPESQMHFNKGEFNRQYCFVAVYNSGGLFAFKENEFTEEAKTVMRRFASVFDLTYKRFLDLQKAEAQAKEAQIEAALEKVRSRSLAMRNSNELQGVITTLFDRLSELNIEAATASILIPNDDKTLTQTWIQNAQRTYSWAIYVPYFPQNIVSRYFQEAFIHKEDILSKCFSQEEKNEWFTLLFDHTEMGKIPEERKKYVLDSECYCISVIHTKHGGIHLGRYINKPFGQEETGILRRFAKVFEQAYIRFLDLQKAEAQAREAQIEAALERTRSQSMLMQHSHELEHASQVFHEQLQLLGINSAFSYLWLLKEQEAEQTFWASWSEEKNGVIQYRSREITYPLDKTNPYIAECLIQWKSDETRPHLSVVPPEGVKDYFETWEELFRDVESLRPEAFPDGLCYADAYMKYGSFGVVMSRDLTDEEYNILRRFSVEFERTYTRFLDLKQTERLARQSEQDLVQLKIEKQKTEEALEELQATQKQLIQSEKMASLGELTAGIAHEIQNPLNFVNNFSEVSNELLDEMIEEMQKGNYEEVKTIVNDVKQNLEKINHHGKRADGIVKGMLQHSRSSTGQRELTDINALADEYLRLAYHGLRAKDKSFSAKFESNLDPSLQKISIIPQELGRVILNLINNAFYAVSEKKKQGIAGYEPKVIVATRKGIGKIEISVKDNGNGIPQPVLDKIFQPFFTTKPTGQGTGLGLSLSYDIVKAHSGELKVDTREGVGSEFIIQLPAT